MSKSSLTKIITFTPFYMIQNCLRETVWVWELDSTDHERDMLEIGPGITAPFWPNYGAEMVINLSTAYQHFVTLKYNTLYELLTSRREYFAALPVIIRVNSKTFYI